MRQLTLEQAKTICCAAGDIQASDAEGVVWWVEAT